MRALSSVTAPTYAPKKTTARRLPHNGSRVARHELIARQIDHDDRINITRTHARRRIIEARAARRGEDSAVPGDLVAHGPRVVGRGRPREPHDGRGRGLLAFAVLD